MFEKQKIFIFGMARSGYETAKVLLKRNNEVLICDSKQQDENHVNEIEKMGGKIIITETPDQYLDQSFDYMIKNPGIRKDHPCVIKARNLKIKVINELEMSYHLLPKNVCIIGITGSNGKTTTTTLTYEILKNAGLPVHLGGNIGYPLSSLVSKVKERDILLLEISDHQLCDMYDFKCNISVLTNITPTHLDFHDSYDQYKEMKKRIFNHQTNNDIVIVNRGNEEALSMIEDLPSQILYFSSKEGKACYDECFFENNQIYFDIEHGIENQAKQSISIEELKLKGIHNYENMMAAIIIAKCLHVKNREILDALKRFIGVAHRLEFVLEKNGIEVYNDSKSTNNVSTQIALSSFSRPTILIMGGYNRNQEYDDLLSYMKNIKMVICYGETGKKIDIFLKNHNISSKVVETIKEAVELAYEKASSGDIILLSPAHASWDQYNSFEERGEEFKEEIKRLYQQ